MRPAIKKFLIPFLIGAVLVGGLWGYVAFRGRGGHDELADELAACKKTAATGALAEGKAKTAAAELATCKSELASVKATSKAGTWFCGLPDDSGSACFASRAECEGRATACREQAYAVCAGDRCFSDVWGCVKQATAGPACETRR
jgi:hypothetical protein